MKVAINEFVRRQTAESRFTHFEGTWDELVELVEGNFHKAIAGYRDGVMLIPVPAEKFFCVGELQEGKTYEAVFAPRREGEDPYLQVQNDDHKQPCRVVEVVIYRHDVLAEDGDATTDAEWEIISLNGRTSEEPEPMSPLAMARNFLGLQGGTKGEFTAEDFAKAIVYWSRRA